MIPSLPTDQSSHQGTVIGIDLQHMSPLDGATLLGGCDFTSQDTQQKIRDILNDRKADVVLSDMAPKDSGIKSHNHTNIVDLCFTLLRLCLPVLKPGGTMGCKLWEGERSPKLQSAMKTVFENVRRVKPDASRDDSAEFFLIGMGFTKK